MQERVRGVRPPLALRGRGVNPMLSLADQGRSGRSVSPLRDWAVQDVCESGEEMIEVKRFADEYGAQSSPIVMSRTH